MLAPLSSPPLLDPREAILKIVNNARSYHKYILSFSDNSFFLVYLCLLLLFLLQKNNFSPKSSLEILLQPCQNSYGWARPLPLPIHWHTADAVLAASRKSPDSVSTAPGCLRFLPCHFSKRCNVTFKKLND